MEIDAASGVPFEAGVEEASGIRPRGALGEGQLDFDLVGPPSADNPVVEPNLNTRRIGGFLRFTSSTSSVSASRMRVRIRASVSPRQPPSILIFAPVGREGESAPFPFSERLYPRPASGAKRPPEVMGRRKFLLVTFPTRHRPWWNNKSLCNCRASHSGGQGIRTPNRFRGT